MGERLKGKRCFVTAAGAGIGQACAEAFRAEGAEVIATDINLGLLGANGAGRIVEALDVTDDAAVMAAAARHGRIDVLLNAAGFVHHGTLLDCSPEDWAHSINLNLTSMARTMRAFLPAMIAGGGGSIINIASVASSIKGAPNRCVYGTTKAGVIGLTKSVAADFVGQGVRANAICPGTIDTPSLHDRMAATGDVTAARQAFVARQPMGRLGEAAEVAALAVYLASDEAAFTTGAVHVIDGGWSN